MNIGFKSIIVFLSLSSSVDGAGLRDSSMLTTIQELSTSGARAVAPFEINGQLFLAVPQLAEDIPDQLPNMNGGNSDVDVVVYQARDTGFEEYQRIPSHGSEDAEFFSIDGRHFLAIACIRSGAGPYNFYTDSTIYEWDGKRFVPFQKVASFAAKQWRHFEIRDRNFLALAVGVVDEDQKEAARDSNSVIYEWNGRQFEQFQIIPSVWAYNWEFFELDGSYFLGVCDNVIGSVLYRWNGIEFAEFQTFNDKGGRELDYFIVDGNHFLALANLLSASRIYRWNGRKFAPFQTFDGLGGHNFELVDNQFLFRINFVTGGRHSPKPDLLSQIYFWNDERFELVESFPTLGGTDISTFVLGNKCCIAVSNSLAKDLRFQVNTVIYDFSPKID